MEPLRGMNALVTGAAGGLGHYIARALAAEGVNLVLSDIPGAPLDDLVEELRARGVRVEAETADLADRPEAEALIGRAEAALGPIDVLVNNAGLEFGGPFLDNSVDELERIVDVNLLAVMLLTREALPGMFERRRGHVVNVASAAGKLASPQLASYAATKHAVVGFTHSLRAEHRGSPIGFSAICPIFVSRVGMYGRLEDQVPDPPPMFKPVPPEDVGAAVVRAIREDRAEIIVGGRILRPLALLYHAAPKLFARISDNRRQREFADAFARARERL
ncbi:MAG TPA: SDR family NAD(P)-dependent oxidoreductase [Solirubrobacterales bacterium]|nr:SDR family NAD(P)-dependent oxidoreductase [Solirubrobacterales bacterium]